MGVRLGKKKGSGDDRVRLLRKIPKAVSDKDKTGPASDRAQNADPEFSRDARLKTRPQPETAIAEDCEKEEDVMEVLE
jgi:hypothetical protein